MAGGIFQVGDTGELIQFVAEAYEREDVLQTYVERYPDLLAGDQIDPDVPRRWVLVRREQPIARDDSGVDWWSIDHLFLDQDAVPTLVEAKRSGDRRVRREVIGQMMEYAAHAVVHWSVEKMRADFEMTCAAAGVEPGQRLTDLLALADDALVDDEVERFWRSAKENLEDGHLRLLFVADEFPAETKRIIEFLNQKMNDVEVLAIEIRQFTGGGRPILVPRLYGQNEATRQRKTRSRQTRTWDEESYFAKMELEHPELVDVTRRVYDWADQRGLVRTWGSGTEIGSLSLRVGGRTGSRIVTLYTDGNLEFAFQYLKPPFGDPDSRKPVVDRFAAVEGLVFPSDAASNRPNLPLALLLDDTRFQAFLAVIDWWARENEAAGSSGMPS